MKLFRTLYFSYGEDLLFAFLITNTPVIPNHCVQFK